MLRVAIDPIALEQRMDSGELSSPFHELISQAGFNSATADKISILTQLLIAITHTIAKQNGLITTTGQSNNRFLIDSNPELRLAFINQLTTSDRDNLLSKPSLTRLIVIVILFSLPNH